MTRARASMMLCGPNKVAEFKMGRKRLDLVDDPILGPQKVYHRVTKDDRIVTVDQGTNDLIVKDAKTRKVYSHLKGYKETPYSKLAISRIEY